MAEVCEKRKETPTRKEAPEQGGARNKSTKLRLLRVQAPPLKGPLRRQPHSEGHTSNPWMERKPHPVTAETLTQTLILTPGSLAPDPCNQAASPTSGQDAVHPLTVPVTAISPSQTTAAPF